MKIDKPTKCEKVLAKLQTNKIKGVFSFDLLAYGGLRYAARILDLKKQGYEIVSHTEKRGEFVGCRYFLV